MAAQQKHSVLFVCLGNICRSPMAEIVFREEAKSRGVLDDWLVDSAGTASYHTGESPDSRSVSTCKKHYKDLKVTHRARQVSEDDFFTFEYILCMDNSNLADLKDIRPNGAKSHLALLGSFDPQGEKIIKDPYYGGLDGFEHNFQQCVRSCNALLDSVYNKENKL